MYTPKLSMIMFLVLSKQIIHERQSVNSQEHGQFKGDQSATKHNKAPAMDLLPDT